MMRRKWLCWIAGLGLALAGLAGCGGKNNNPAAAQQSDSTSRFSAPVKGADYADRLCPVSGVIKDWQATMSAQVSVNGATAQPLTVNADGTFSYIAGLVGGANTVIVTSASNSATLNINGVFPNQALWTQLWWSVDHTDVDLHLVPIDGANGARDDCFFQNMTPSWGAVLDRDQQDGLGPEHITATTLSDGTYKLFVSYYDPRGVTDIPAVHVAVSVNNAAPIIYSLPALTNQGDTWEVCTITYPGGAIANLNNYIPATTLPPPAPMVKRKR